MDAFMETHTCCSGQSPASFHFNANEDGNMSIDSGLTELKALNYGFQGVREIRRGNQKAIGDCKRDWAKLAADLGVAAKCKTGELIRFFGEITGWNRFGNSDPLGIPNAGKWSELLAKHL
mmetsp:Transcript_21814/g.40862  ORF Transcript_21814/g.40862 Transcript_21814/m.40862 type:complete len:120 (-) Transcript_21814:263-622(-)